MPSFFTTNNIATFLIFLLKFDNYKKCYIVDVIFINCMAGFLAKIISTFFYSGLIKPASGTFGTLFSLIFYYLFAINTLSILAQIIIIIVVFVISLFCIKNYSKSIGVDDPKEIVIDEFLGIFVSLIFSKIILGFVNANEIFSKPIILLQLNSLYAYFTAIDGNDAIKFVLTFTGLNFAFFRLFDITKPYPCSFFDKKVKNSFGVIMDDIVAGIYSACLTAACMLLIFA